MATKNMWVSIKRAASVLNVSDRFARKLARNGRFGWTRKVNDGSFRVNMKSVLNYAISVR